MEQSEFDPDEEVWATRLAACDVLGMDGGKLRIRDLWRGGPTVTAFLRHYGCLFCMQFVHDVLEAAPDIVGRGAVFVLIGNGSVEQARRFFDERRLPRPGIVVATDPKRESYKVAQLHRGFWRTFLQKPARRAYVRATAAGFHVEGLKGDLTQLGGLTVTSPPARLHYLHRSEAAGDHPALPAVLAGVERAARRRSYAPP